ncbi:MAG TPA: hypothetical protein PLK12_15050, partial [Prolixibacteraceae bacterium]|nr:hypothetical protein [Prolixibacteraceae bacterium]
KFHDIQTMDYKGKDYQYSSQSYGEALNWAGFCGGPSSESKWMTRESLMNALHEFGFQTITCNFENTHHPNGPSLALCASKE